MRAQINRKNRIKEHVIRTNVEGSIDMYERGREHYKRTKIFFLFICALVYILILKMTQA